MLIVRLILRSTPVAVLLFCALDVGAQDSIPQVVVQWNAIRSVSKTTPTLQVVVNPPLRRGTAVHDGAFQTLHDIGADYVRYVPWLPYPRLGVAELEPPKDGKTSWNLSLIDPMTIDFLDATRGHSVVLNFSTIPQWMYKTEKPVSYPDDPDAPVWDYEQGTELSDPSGKEVADYYARLLAWYTKGGFTDEMGARKDSGYHYSIPYWEVLNEVDSEHRFSPQAYTRLYDAIVSEMARVQPETKFVGVSLALPGQNPEFFEYFLDHKNHRPGIPLDYISYHFYAVPSPDETLDVQQHTVFAQTDGFLNTVRYIESIRKRLSPETGTMINEIGIISADDGLQEQPGHVSKPIPDAYWNLAGAEYAYIFGNLAEIGIDVAGESQLVGYPTQYPSVSMVDWNDGRPNARVWVLRLLRENFGPGDRIVEISSSAHVYGFAVVTKTGIRRLLLVNKRNRDVSISVAGAAGSQVESVDVTTGFKPPLKAKLNSENVTLHGFAVSLITLP